MDTNEIEAVIKAIKENCSKQVHKTPRGQRPCSYCLMGYTETDGYDYCLVKAIAHELSDSVPMDWNINKIRWFLNK